MNMLGALIGIASYAVVLITLGNIRPLWSLYYSEYRLRDILKGQED